MISWPLLLLLYFVLVAEMQWDLCMLQCWGISKLEMKLYVIIWLFPKKMTEITKYHWFEMCENNNDKVHIINIQIKIITIIIVQNKIEKYVPFIVQ